MNYDYPQSDLSRGLLGGLFAGIVAALANMIFVFVYRRMESFNEFSGMDATVVIFGSILLSIACGILFYLLVHYLKKGILFYRVIVLIVTVAIVYLGLFVRRSVMGEVPDDFRTMVIVTQVIIGGLAAFLIPYLFRHDSIIS